MRKRFLTWLNFLLPAALALASVQTLAVEEFLKPDEAFRVSAKQDGDSIRVHWDITEGYYLYASKFRFRSENPNVQLGSPRLPEGETKHDEFFGEVEVFRNAVDVSVPLLKGADQATVTLEAQSQGCADAGLCYPPHRQTLLVALADIPTPDAAAVPAILGSDTTPTAPASEPVADAQDDAIAELNAFADDLGLGGFDDDILPAEEAFVFTGLVESGDQLKLRWDIAEGTYLYADKFKLDIEGEGVALGAIQMPKPKIKHDSVTPDGEIGDVEAYVSPIDLVVPLVRSSTAETRAKLTASYQGCADRGICYPPQKTVLDLVLPAVSAATAQPATDGAPATAQSGSQSEPQSSGDELVAEQDQIAAMLAGGSFWAIVGTFLIIGLGLSLTPCVFPMIPILSGIITGQGHDITPAKGFVLSLVYVLAMALTYAVAGVFAALSGENLQAALQNPWALSIFASVFVLLALSMFGFYDIQLPASWQSKLSEISNRQEGGTLTGVAIMGLLSALIVGPCVAPPLAGALIYIGQTGDAFLGFTALFAMSMGMGAPLLAIGASAGKLLPKAGAWMDTVKAVFGVVMLGVAIYLMERVLPLAVIMLLWGLLLIVSGIYMGAFTSLTDGHTGWNKLWKGLGTGMAVYGMLMLVGAASGGNDTLQPLKGLGFAGGSSAESSHVAFKRIKTVDDLDRELTASTQPVMLDFYADWCVYCKQMEKNTFPDPAVRALLDDMLLLQADVTDNDDLDKALLARFSIPAPPAMLFFEPNGEERRNYRLLGYMGPEDFANHVRGAIQ